MDSGLGNEQAIKVPGYKGESQNIAKKMHVVIKGVLFEEKCHQNILSNLI